jgi:hypothetical protein
MFPRAPTYRGLSGNVQPFWILGDVFLRQAGFGPFFFFCGFLGPFIDAFTIIYPLKNGKCIYMMIYDL